MNARSRVKARNLCCRLLGMTPLFSTSCSEPWSVSILPHSWTYFANPIALFCTFIALSLDIAYHRSKMVSNRCRVSFFFMTLSVLLEGLEVRLEDARVCLELLQVLSTSPLFQSRTV